MSNPETKEEQARRECEELIESCIVTDVDSHGERVKSILIAIKIAKIPLNSMTSSALHELAVRLGSITEDLED